MAAKLGVYLLLGSFNERCTEIDRCFNTSILFGPDGDRLAVYRKIHLFDFDLSPQMQFEESANVCPGDRAVVVETAVGKIGFAICYDLRFSDLFRQLREHGAELVVVPSAFTVPTGQAHWQPLLRTRAIEEQIYVIAPAQWGRHDEAGIRESYGHSAIVDPWGIMLAQAADGRGLALAEIDLDRVASIRKSMPVEAHRRLLS